MMMSPLTSELLCSSRSHKFLIGDSVCSIREAPAAVDSLARLLAARSRVGSPPIAKSRAFERYNIGNTRQFPDLYILHPHGFWQRTPHMLYEKRPTHMSNLTFLRIRVVATYINHHSPSVCRGPLNVI